MKTHRSPFFAARDQLLEFSDDPAQARAEFTRPDVGDSFNWAHDVFDVIAEGNETIALRISARQLGHLDEDVERSFAQLKTRSDQVGNWLLRAGLKRGDVAMVVLPERVELWEVMLAAMKIGVVVVPTPVGLEAKELADRAALAKVSAVIASPAEAVKFTEVPGRYHRIGVGLDEGTKDQRALLWEWTRYEESTAASLATIPKKTASDDPALQFFTPGSGDRQGIETHSHTSFPMDHLATLAWLGIRSGDTHLAVSDPGSAMHAWASLFVPWSVGATVFVVRVERFDPDLLIAELDRAGVTTFCASPEVWRVLADRQLAKPRALREVALAGEVLDPEVVSRIEASWGVQLRQGYEQV